MFKDNPYKDWTNHAADEFRYAAVVENKMFNEQDEVDYIPQEPKWMT